MNKDFLKEFKLPAEVYETALKVIVKEYLNIENFEVICSAGSSKGDNFLGEIIRIEVKSREKHFCVILKIPTQNFARREKLHMEELFQREIQFYDEVFKMYNGLQKKKGINIEIEGLHEIPFCFKLLTKAPLEGIFLEDLKQKGFKIFPSKQGFTKDHVILVVKALAKKHALSLCLKNQQPLEFNKYRSLNDLFVDIYKNKANITYSWVSAQIRLAKKHSLNLTKAISKKRCSKY